jgi:hypothetical protein
VIPSNEEVINELTKDLDSANIKAAEESCSNDNEYEPRKLDQEGSNVENSVEEDINKFAAGDSDESENEKHVKVEDDLIDEDALKDLETTYSVEDKEVLNVTVQSNCLFP